MVCKVPKFHQSETVAVREAMGTRADHSPQGMKATKLHCDSHRGKEKLCLRTCNEG